MNRLGELQGVLLRWLAVAAGLDWLLLRTLSRAAVHMPKEDWMRGIFSALQSVGHVAFTAAGVLSMAAVLLLAWRERRAWRGMFTVLGLGLVGLGLALVVIPPSAGARFLFAAGVLLAMVLLADRTWRGPAPIARRLAWIVPLGAVVLAQVRHGVEAARSLGLNVPPEAPLMLGAVTELLIVLAAGACFYLLRGARVGRVEAIAGALAGLLFAGFYLAAPWMAAILAIWSVGLTLYLPWPAYALAVGLAVAAFAAAARRRDSRGLAVVLLLAGGAAPQLSAHAFLHLLAIEQLAPEPASEAAGFSVDKAHVPALSS